MGYVIYRCLDILVHLINIGDSLGIPTGIAFLALRTNDFWRVR